MENGEYTGWMRCYDWCKEHITQNHFKYIGDGVFEFKNEQDCILFKLRWE